MGYEVRRPPIAGQGEKPTTRKPTPTPLGGAREIAIGGTRPSTSKPKHERDPSVSAGRDETTKSE